MNAAARRSLPDAPTRQEGPVADPPDAEHVGLPRVLSELVQDRELDPAVLFELGFRRLRGRDRGALAETFGDEPTGCDTPLDEILEHCLARDAESDLFRPEGPRVSV